jgi:hypothetical protein
MEGGKNAVIRKSRSLRGSYEELKRRSSGTRGMKIINGSLGNPEEKKVFSFAANVHI